MRTRKKTWKTVLVLAAIGVAASFFMKDRNGTSGLMFATDLLFTVAMAFFCWGLCCLVGNMGVFNGLTYGTKCLIRLIRGKRESSEQMKDGYLAYIASRPRHADAPRMLCLGAVFVVLSVLLSFAAA